MRLDHRAIVAAPNTRFHLRAPGARDHVGVNALSGLGEDPISDPYVFVDPNSSTGPFLQDPPPGWLNSGATPDFTPANLPGFNSGMNASQIASLIAAAGGAASTALRATQSPYLIPGTNILYNPGTGQIVGSPAGITGTQLAGGASLLMPAAVLGIGLLVILSMGRRS
jgi:hypothetical protein